MNRFRIKKFLIWIVRFWMFFVYKNTQLSSDFQTKNKLFSTFLITLWRYFSYDFTNSKKVSFTFCSIFVIQFRERQYVTKNRVLINQLNYLMCLFYSRRIHFEVKYFIICKHFIKQNWIHYCYLIWVIVLFVGRVCRLYKTISVCPYYVPSTTVHFYF